MYVYSVFRIPLLISIGWGNTILSALMRIMTMWNRWHINNNHLLTNDTKSRFIRLFAHKQMHISHTCIQIQTQICLVSSHITPQTQSKLFYALNWQLYWKSMDRSIFCLTLRIVTQFILVTHTILMFDIAVVVLYVNNLRAKWRFTYQISKIQSNCYCIIIIMLSMQLLNVLCETDWEQSTKWIRS